MNKYEHTIFKAAQEAFKTIIEDELLELKNQKQEEQAYNDDQWYLEEDQDTGWQEEWK